MTPPIGAHVSPYFAVGGVVNAYSLSCEQTSGGQASHARISAGSAPNLIPTGSCTIGQWHKRAVAVDATYILATNMAKWDTSSSNFAYYLAVFWDGSQEVVRAFISQNTATSVLDLAHWTSGLPAVGVWGHYALTIDTANPSATTFELFVNGSSLGNGTMIISNNCSSLNTNSGGTITIGQVTAQVERGKRIDRPWFFKDTVLTQPQIASYMSGSMTGSEAGIALLDEYENTFDDLTANSYDFTAYGSGAAAPSFLADPAF